MCHDPARLRRMVVPSVPRYPSHVFKGDPMSFSGKATFTAGTDLPELIEDVSDIIGIVSPFETPLLNHLGDAKRPATSTIHEWLEDTLLPNTDSVNQTVFTPNATDCTAAPAANPQGSTTIRRSMNGIIKQIATNQYTPGSGGIPAGGGEDAIDLTEAVLNAALRKTWERSSGKIDTIVVNGLQKRRINQF